MKRRVAVYFYRLTDGVFSGLSFSGPEASLEANTPPGCGAIDMAMVTDWPSQRVDVASGDVVDWQPPAPPDTEWQTWSWDPDSRRWLASPTVAAQWRSVRHDRDQRLAQTDWVVLRAVDRGEAVPADWLEYRQALRDITLQPDPTSIDWPLPPSA